MCAPSCLSRSWKALFLGSSWAHLWASRKAWSSRPSFWKAWALRNLAFMSPGSVSRAEERQTWDVKLHIQPLILFQLGWQFMQQHSSIGAWYTSYPQVCRNYSFKNTEIWNYLIISVSAMKHRQLSLLCISWRKFIMHHYIIVSFLNENSEFLFNSFCIMWPSDSKSMLNCITKWNN